MMRRMSIGVSFLLVKMAAVVPCYSNRLYMTMPFLCGVQGEGRKWTATFSQEALGIFDYLFTDAMTIIDHKGRNSRIYRAEEALFHRNGIPFTSLK